MPGRLLTAAPASAPALARPRQVTCAYVGDSLTQGGTATYRYGDAYPTYVALASQGRIIPSGFYGVGGQRSDQILARVQQALSTRPNYLAVLAGTNDIGQGIASGKTDAQILDVLKGNLRAMYRAAEAVGTVPVLITIPPNNDASNNARRQILIIKANVWIRRHAMRSGYPLVDFYTLLVKDGITATPAGAYKDAYALDGTHPNAAGVGALGALFATTLAGTAAASPLTTVDTVDQYQAVLAFQNPLFKNNAGNPGKRPDGFSAYGAPITDTHTVYALGTDTVLPGNVVTMTQDTSATAGGGLASSYFSCAKGDLFAIAGHFSTDGATNVQSQLVLGGTTYYPMLLGQAGTAITRGLYYMEVVAPAASAVNQAIVIAALRSGVASAVMFDCPTVINLTQTIGETTPITPN